MKTTGQCRHCSNGGTCVSFDEQTYNYQCICAVQFKGAHCEQDVDECESRLSVVCPSGSQCMNHFGGYTCRCPAGEVLLRSSCVKKLTCHDDLCRNNAICYNVPGEHRDYVCECPLGFTGVNCHIAVQECSPVSPCGEHGICIAGIPGFRCDCLSGYFGKLCQDHRSFSPDLHQLESSASTANYSQSSSSDLFSPELTNVLTISGGVLLSLSVFGGLLLYCILVLRRYKIHASKEPSDIRTRRGHLIQAMTEVLCCASNVNRRGDYVAVDNHMRQDRSPGKLAKSPMKRTTLAKLKVINRRIHLAEENTKNEMQSLTAQLSKINQGRPRAQKSIDELQLLLSTV